MSEKAIVSVLFSKFVQFYAKQTVCSLAENKLNPLKLCLNQRYHSRPIIEKTNGIKSAFYKWRKDGETENGADKNGLIPPQANDKWEIRRTSVITSILLRAATTIMPIKMILTSQKFFSERQQTLLGVHELEVLQTSNWICETFFPKIWHMGLKIPHFGQHWNFKHPYLCQKSNKKLCVLLPPSTFYAMTLLSIRTNYRVQQKSGPLKFFAVFSATVGDFNIKFYSFF